MSLKKLLFKDEAKVPKKEKPVSNVSSTQVHAKPIVTSQGVSDEKFIDMLEGLIEQASSTEKHGYFNFKKAIEGMKSLNLDEKTKFQTVFTVLSQQGCKKEMLLSTADSYIKLVEDEKKSFNNELQVQRKEKVQNKIDQIDLAKKEVENLTKKLSEMNANIIELSQSAQTEELKLKTIEANFKESADNIISQISIDKEKINNFIII
jgi:hypothetical protein